MKRDLEKKIKIKKTSNQGFEEKTMGVMARTVHKVGKFSGCEIQMGLRQIFVGLTRFCGDSIAAYEELCSSAMEESSRTREKQEQSQAHS